jgi:hypothetical protein
LRKRSIGPGPRVFRAAGRRMAISFFTLSIKQLFVRTNRKTAERRLMIGRKDLEDLEKAEQQIDQFIERRARERAHANKEEEFWVEQERRRRERRHEENRLAWHSYHLGQAERIERTAADLAASHRSKAEALTDEGEGVGS